jgi:hypothetical protein
MQPDIHLHIEQLVLRGVELTPSQRQQLQAGLEAALTQQLTQGGLAPELLRSANPVVAAQAMPWRSGQDAAQLGQSIARAVYGGIGRE